MGFNHLCPPAMFANKYTAVTATDRWYVAEIRRWPVRILTQLNSAAGPDLVEAGPCSETKMWGPP